jgi:hypothetical protein
MKSFKEIICLKCIFLKIKITKESSMQKLVETQELQGSPPLESKYTQ